MAKVCIKEDCNNPVFGKGFCRNHQYLREKNPKAKTIYTIPKLSEKMKETLKDYRLVRDEYMRSHQKCEFENCDSESHDLHHKAKRGSNLSNVDTFMAICRLHHNWIHEHSKEAREMGYLD